MSVRSHPEFSVREKCKFEHCRAPKNATRYCAYHQVMLFLIHLKYSFKRNFGATQKGLAELGSGSITQSSLANFLNFLRISHSTDDIVNTLAQLGKGRKSRGEYCMHSTQLAEALSTPSIKLLTAQFRKHQIKEIRTSLQATYHRMFSDFTEFAVRLQEDSTGLISEREITSIFRGDPTTISLLFFDQFGTDKISIEQLKLLLLTEDSDSEDEEILRKLAIQTSSRPSRPLLPSRKSRKLTDEDHFFLEEFHRNLVKFYRGMSEAYEAICNTDKAQLNYYKVKTTLGLMRMETAKAAIILVIRLLGRGSLALPIAKFKEFWTGRTNLCNTATCFRAMSNSSNYCNFHLHSAANIVTRHKSHDLRTSNPTLSVSTFLFAKTRMPTLAGLYTPKLPRQLRPRQLISTSKW